MIIRHKNTNDVLFDGDIKDLEGVDLRFAVLRRANLDGADLSGANLIGANLDGADLSGANLIYANLACADLRFADLRFADLSGADLEDADLRDANLRDANLDGADLEDANLEGADLRGANLEGANLEGANLEGANLEGANLEGANLRDAILYCANLDGADLSGANLRGANLEDVEPSGSEALSRVNDELMGKNERLKRDRDKWRADAQASGKANLLHAGQMAEALTNADALWCEQSSEIERLESELKKPIRFLEIEGLQDLAQGRYTTLLNNGTLCEQALCETHLGPTWDRETPEFVLCRGDDAVIAWNE